MRGITRSCSVGFFLRYHSYRRIPTCAAKLMSTNSNDAEDYISWLDVPYVTGANNVDDKHKLDIYTAKKPFPRAMQPVFIFVHGGMWTRGNRRVDGGSGLYGNVGKICADNGIVGIIPSYRLSPSVKHPEHVKDIARVIRWTIDNVHQFGGDKSKLFLGGHSAGAHLTALILCDKTYLKNTSIDTDSFYSNCLRGFIGISGVYNLPKLSQIPLGNTFVPYIFGSREKIERASPIHVIKDQAHSNRNESIANIPMYLINAEEDLTLGDDSAEFIEAIESTCTKPHSNTSITHAVYQGETHFSTILNVFRKERKTDKEQQDIFEFIHKNSKNKQK